MTPFYDENCMILTSTVFGWSTVWWTDSIWTHGRNIRCRTLKTKHNYNQNLNNNSRWVPTYTATKHMKLKPEFMPSGQEPTCKTVLLMALALCIYRQFLCQSRKLVCGSLQSTHVPRVLWDCTRVYKWTQVDCNMQRDMTSVDSKTCKQRVRASSVHDHFGTYHFGTGFSPNLKFGPLRYMY